MRPRRRHHRRTTYRAMPSPVVTTATSALPTGTRLVARARNVCARRGEDAPRQVYQDLHGRWGKHGSGVQVQLAGLGPYCGLTSPKAITQKFTILDVKAPAKIHPCTRLDPLVARPSRKSASPGLWNRLAHSPVRTISESRRLCVKLPAQNG